MGNAKEYEENIGMGRIDVKQGSAYAHINGLRFAVVEKHGNRISLKINGVTTDFYGCEVSVYTMSCGWMGYGLAKSWNVA